MELEKVQIPVHSDLILKTWNIPVTELVEKERISSGKVGRGLFAVNVFKTEPVLIYSDPYPEGEEYEIVYNEVLSTKDYLKSIKENEAYFQLKEEYMELINEFRENLTDQFIGGMPVQLEKNCLSPLFKKDIYNRFDYYLTLKVDGTRYLMSVSKNGVIYFIDRVTNLFYFKRPGGTAIGLGMPSGEKLLPFLFDGELVQHSNGRWEYLIFDVLLYPRDGKVFNWMPFPYHDRYRVIETALEQIRFPEFDISVKKWFPIEFIVKSRRPKPSKDDPSNINNVPIYEYIKYYTNKGRKIKLNEDGLVLQPFEGYYVQFREWNVHNNIQFKWKPPSELTVDFKIRYNPENEDVWWLLTSTGQNYDVPQGKKKPPVHAIVLPTKSDRLKYRENDVVECKLKQGIPQRNVFEIIRKREDKTQGNSLQTIMGTMEVVMNPFNLDILSPALESLITGKDLIENVCPFYSKSKLILCSTNIIFTKEDLTEIEKIYNTFFGIKAELEFFPSPKKESDVTREDEVNLAFQNPYLVEREIETEDEPYTIEALEAGEFGFGMESIPESTKKRYKSIKKSATVYDINEFEMEFRIYPFIKGGKKENIKKFTYFYLLDFLNKTIPHRNTIYIIDFMSNNGSSVYRSTYTDSKLKNPINIEKRNIYSYKSVPKHPDEKLYNGLTFKLSLATEKKSSITIGIKPDNKVRGYDIIRKKARTSFFPNYEGQYLWRIDLTRVLTIKDIRNTIPSVETFELECEYLNVRVPFETFIKSINDIYKTILFNTGYC